MRKIKYEVDVGYVGCGDSGTQIVPDDMTNAEIDEMVQDIANEWAQTWEGDERLGWSSDNTEEENEQETAYYYENISGSWRFVNTEED